MKQNCIKSSLFFALSILMMMGLGYAQNATVSLSLSVENAPKDGNPTITIQIPGENEIKIPVNADEKNIKKFDNFSWSKLKDIKLDASVLYADVKKTKCADKVPAFVNNEGKLLDTVDLTLNFDFVKSGVYQVLCNMVGIYKKDATVSLSAKLAPDTSPREISFAIDNAIEKYSLSSEVKTLKEAYPMSKLIYPMAISTKKSLGSAEGDCPAIMQLVNEKQILKAVTYEISLKNDLVCVPTFTWGDIP